MRPFNFKSALIHSGLAASALLLGSGAAFGAPQVVNLTAGPATATLPDGSAVPMWGYSCGAAASLSTRTTGGKAVTLAAGCASKRGRVDVSDSNKHSIRRPAA